MKRYYFGISVGIIIMLILPVSVIANSMEYNSYKISGYIGNDKNSEDPYTTGSELYIPSYHPQIDAIRISNNHYTGIVFVSEIGYAQQIRIALNLPSVGWWFAWIDSDEDLDQDHPDIQFYVDYRDSSKVKAIVVWQQRLEDEQYGTNDDWDIQGCIIDCSSSPPTIGSSFSISDNNDENDKYPKVATESYSGGDSKVFFNVVWQNESASYTNRYGIQLWRKYTDNAGNYIDISNIVSPTSYSDDYKEPAIDCIIYNEDLINLYIVYDKYHQESDPQISDDFIVLKYGTSGRNNLNLNPPFTIDETTLGDGSMGWPDVSVIGQVQGGNGNTVDIVWIKNEDNNDKVKYARSLDGGGTFNYIEIDDDGDSGFNNLRYVAVDSFWSDASTYKCCVIWTTSDDVYYKIRNNNAAFLEQRNADTSEYDSDYVDVAIYKNSSDTIVFHGTWQRSGSAVLYGCDP